MEKKDLPKQQRRKRKDPQSRDFRCKCGKSYLSYAAVYTHVKNKHDGNQQYEDAIVKPQKQKLKRGRPKDKKQIIISNQTKCLSICQQTTLLIYDQLKQKKDNFSHHIILQGNQQMNDAQFSKQYQALTSLHPLKTNIFSNLKPSQQNSIQSKQQSEYQFIQLFIRGVVKHFSAQIAARVSYVVQYIIEATEEVGVSQSEEMEQILGELNKFDIWYGQDEINKILFQAMQKWQQLGHKQQIQE